MPIESLLTLPLSLRWRKLGGALCPAGHVFPVGLCHRDVHFRIHRGTSFLALLLVVRHVALGNILLPLRNSKDRKYPLDVVLRVRANNGGSVPDDRMAGRSSRRRSLVRQVKARADLWHLEQSHIDWECAGHRFARVLHSHRLVNGLHRARNDNGGDGLSCVSVPGRLA